MRVILILALALPAVSVAAPSPQSDRVRTAAPAVDCQAYSRLRMADRPAKPARANRLGDEPTGTLALTVHREVNGCPEPAILRTGIGAAPG